jgi:hypothetical protein
MGKGVSETAQVFYKGTDNYAPEYERTLQWDDPDLNIKRGLDAEPVVSAKDQRTVALRDAETLGKSFATAYSPALPRPHQGPKRLRNTLHSRFTCR